MTVAVTALAGAIVVLWRYTEARLDKVITAYRAEIARIQDEARADNLAMQIEHRKEIGQIAARLDAAEEGRLNDARQHGHELKGLAERSIAAHHEASQAIRSMAAAVQRIPCQTSALTPMEIDHG